MTASLALDAYLDRIQWGGAARQDLDTLSGLLRAHKRSIPFENLDVLLGLAFRPERQRVYARAQEMLAADVPWVPLYVRAHWVVTRPDVKNLRLHPTRAHRLDVLTLE